MKLRFAIGLFACILPAAAASCEALRQARIRNTEILSAGQIGSGSLIPDAATGLALTGLPVFCRVVALARPSSDSEIKIEVWLPVHGWNGRALGTGNGGFAGKVSYAPLASGLKSGYAVANTDMGMAVPPGADASVFVGRPERWRDWGFRATHEMTVVQAALVQNFYGRPAARSYFSGCSTGGEQALMEAQRFPEDYDGIVAGAPANNRTGVHLSILWNFLSTRRDEGAAYLPADKLALLHNAVLTACDMQDGLRDGLIADPASCRFDPGTLLCKSGAGSGCLSAAQVETVRRVYAGPVDPSTGNSLYPGVPKGSELDWGRFAPAPGQISEPPYAPIFKWVFGASWEWHAFSLSESPKMMERKLSKDVNATDGNLTRFQKRGGKLIAYHGLADWLVVPGEALRYRSAVFRHTPGNPDRFYRLYLIPGMGHCGGGTGPDNMDALTPLVNWVENSVEPGTLLATRTAAQPGGPLQRPVCAYPQMARYRGTGDPNEPASFMCVPVP